MGGDGAFWVWDSPGADKVDQSNEPHYLRRTFALSAQPVSAELRITADNEYEVFVNGHCIGADNHWWIIKRYDVAQYLVQGNNVLAIRATNKGGTAGAIARLLAKTADSAAVVIGTDAHFRITQAPRADWSEVNFDDSSWASAIVLGNASMEPWKLETPPPTGCVVGTVAGLIFGGFEDGIAFGVFFAVVVDGVTFAVTSVLYHDPFLTLPHRTASHLR